ncbi:hypothetical protein, partial [Cohnella faecalis]
MKSAAIWRRWRDRATMWSPRPTFRDVAQPVPEGIRPEALPYPFREDERIAAAFDSKLDDDELDFNQLMY